MSKVNTPISEEERLLNIKKAGERALAEAHERRQNTKPIQMPKELNGYKGAEPTRFSDWEKKGIISDF